MCGDSDLTLSLERDARNAPVSVGGSLLVGAFFLGSVFLLLEPGVGLALTAGAVGAAYLGARVSGGRTDSASGGVTVS